MKVLLINNFLNNTVGGVENYLETLVSYSEEHKTEIEFKWFGVVEKKTKIYQKLYNRQTTKAIINEIDSFKPDLIHCFSIGATVTPHFMRYAKSKSIPIIQSFRDYYYICPKAFMLDTSGNTLEHHHNFLDCILNHHPKKNIIYDSLLYFKQSYHSKIIKKNTDYFLTPSDNLTKLIKEKFKILGETIPNPILISNSFLEQIDLPCLLFVGRLDPEKGVMTLLKSFKNILQEFPQEQLKIVGSGTIESELQDYVINNNINNVTFLGKKNQKELVHLYASAKFTIVPSEFLESYGNVILESFAFRKTVIISDLLGIEKEIRESNSGLVFPHGNVLKLTESIKKLLTDNILRHELEENASVYVKELSFDNHYKKLELIYKKILKK